MNIHLKEKDYLRYNPGLTVSVFVSFVFVLGGSFILNLHNPILNQNS